MHLLILMSLCLNCILCYHFTVYITMLTYFLKLIITESVPIKNDHLKIDLQPVELSGLIILSFVTIGMRPKVSNQFKWTLSLVYSAFSKPKF
jgi:hypothetical protein